MMTLIILYCMFGKFSIGIGCHVTWLNVTKSIHVMKQLVCYIDTSHEKSSYSILFYYCFTMSSTEGLHQHVLQP